MFQRHSDMTVATSAPGEPAPVLAPAGSLAERTDQLVARTTALRARCEALAERLDSMADTARAPAQAARAAPEEGMRLVAASLALQGVPRAEIDTRLRQEFGPADTDALLDGVLTATGAGRRRRRFFARG